MRSRHAADIGRPRWRLDEDSHHLTLATRPTRETTVAHPAQIIITLPGQASTFFNLFIIFF